jgi:thioredoxin-related protein
VQTIRAAIIAYAVSGLLLLSAQADVSWLSDYRQAQSEAKNGNKLLLLNFTGSDWCGWCIKLEREVFSQPEFQEYAKNNLVLMTVDFPRAKALAGDVRKQNETLAEKYGIQGFPTIVVLNGDGKQVGALGYMAGGPKAFVAELQKLPKS